MNRLENLFLEKLAGDYSGIVREIDSVRMDRRRFPDYQPIISKAKPYTMLNLFLSNRFELSKRIRVASGAVVELTGSLVTLLDDCKDGDWDGVRSKISIPKDVNLEELSQDKSVSGRRALFSTTGKMPMISYNTVTQRLLDKHVGEGLLTLEQKGELASSWTEHALIMDQGSFWQTNHSTQKIEDLTEGKDFPTFNETMTEYVDKIAGKLFEWPVHILVYYSPSLSDQISRLTPLIYRFGRVFQGIDDIEDLLRDMKPKKDTGTIQITSANATIENYGTKEEKSKLRNLVLSQEPVTPKQVYEMFPSLSVLREYLENERASLYNGLKEAGFGDIAILLSRLSSVDYKRMRSGLNERVFGYQLA